MEMLVGFLCFVAFLALLGTAGYAFVTMVASADYRILWRTIRHGRFGLKTAFGTVAVSAVSLGLLTAFKIDASDPDLVVMLVVMLPLALFIVGFAGLALAEFFDNKSTRTIIARRTQEDELAAFVRDRKRAAQEETGTDSPQEDPREAENKTHP